MTTNLLTLLLILTLSGCVSFTGYNDGRALGKGKKEMLASVNLTQSASVDLLNPKNKKADIPILTFPAVAYGGKTGATDKIDLYFRVTTSLNLNGGVKFQLIGTRSSMFAMGIGAELGMFVLNNASIFNTQIPLFTSYHPSENLAIYLTPRYVYQFKSSERPYNFNYFGGNIGILYGKKHKIGLDIGIYRLALGEIERLTFSSLGIGGRFIF